MSTQKVTGRTKSELEELRAEHAARDTDTPFEDQYCLAKIPKQPDDYDGPPRYCTKQGGLKRIGSSKRCKYHGGHGELHTENLKENQNMKHGMNATREHLIEDFDEKDEALYEWVTYDYPKAYGISPDEDPSAAYDLHRLAVAIVRAERGRGYLISEGEVVEKEVRGEDGRIVVDENGEVVTEKSQHYLHDMLSRQDSKITKLEKELGITRKERRRHESTNDAVEAIKNFSELGTAFLSRDEQDYDPDDKPWEDNNGS